MNKISKIKLLDGFYESQNKRTIRIEIKAHKYKNLKISSAQVTPNLLASKHRLNFQNPSTGSGDITLAQETFFHFAFRVKHRKTGKDCLVMIGN